MTVFKHQSVLYQEVIDGLMIKANGIYIDGTLGGGGHAEGILRKLETGKLIGLDKDEDALRAAAERLRGYQAHFIAVKSDYKAIINVLDDLDIALIDGMLLDLGVSSYQLDNAARGFSYMHDAPLDMRMDRSQSFDAKQLVNTYSQTELTEVIRQYGEERWAKRIATFIVQSRRDTAIETTGQLVSIIKQAIPKSARQGGPHPAKRTFQAIRIAVNDELAIIGQTIEQIVTRMRRGGRLAVISFHSLEDRIVKHSFKALATSCRCPDNIPICVCDELKQIEIITRKPIKASRLEIERNPRARSAKLRIAEKV